MISLSVALFTAPINFLVDFLFIDILSAPTSLGNKLADEKEGRNSPQLQLLNRFRVGYTRMFPPSVDLAHARAHTSVEDFIKSTKNKVEECERKSFRDPSQRELATVESIRPTLPTHSFSVKSTECFAPSRNNLGHGIESLSIDELYLDLVDKISEQRKSAKKSIRASIDSAWG